MGLRIKLSYTENGDGALSFAENSDSVIYNKIVLCLVKDDNGIGKSS